MLILSRKPGERVFLGDDIEVVVVQVRGNRVKLGFKAPGYLPIKREEIRDVEGWHPALEDAECV